MLVPGYFIPKRTKLQNVFDFPNFYPKNTLKGEWIGISAPLIRLRYAVLYKFAFDLIWQDKAGSASQRENVWGGQKLALANRS